MRFELWVLWGGFPVNVATTPLVCLGRMSVSWLYINSTVLGRTSGNQQLHDSKSGETFAVPIPVSRTDSIAMAGTVQSSTPSQTNTVYTPLQKYLR
jgi:hypothetical protein